MKRKAFTQESIKRIARQVKKAQQKFVNDNPEFGDPVVFDSWEEVEETAREMGWGEEFLQGVVPLDEYEKGFDEEGVGIPPDAKDKWQRQFKGSRKAQAGNDSEGKYWEDVRMYAEEVQERRRNEGEDIEDLLHEAIGESQWVIYYAIAPKTMMYTRNPDALFDHGMEVSGQSFNEIVTQFAFWALYEDVMQVYSQEFEEDFDEEY